jgi:hypothetical protein
MFLYLSSHDPSQNLNTNPPKKMMLPFILVGIVSLFLILDSFINPSHQNHVAVAQLDALSFSLKSESCRFSY